MLLAWISAVMLLSPFILRADQLQPLPKLAYWSRVEVLHKDQWVEGRLMQPSLDENGDGAVCVCNSPTPGIFAAAILPPVIIVRYLDTLRLVTENVTPIKDD